MNKSIETLKAVKIVLLSLLLVFIAAGCEREGNAAENNKNDWGTKKDVKHARQLWDQIKDYKEWKIPDQFPGWAEGVSPHGEILRYYINQKANEDLTQDGAVIVKENYSEKSPDALMSVTVMQKREGYDPETNNWFYVKYSPDGKVMDDEDGKPVAGLVGKGKESGCIPCHKTAGGNDYLFMND